MRGAANHKEPVSRGALCDTIENLTTTVQRLEQELAAEKDKAASELPRLVVCAIILRNGNVLLEKRAPSGIEGLDGMWDLPGGKVECGETPEVAIIREMAEELGIAVEPAYLVPYLPISTWVYPDGQRRHWILAAYRCQIFAGEPECSSRLQWVDVKYLSPASILKADLELIRIALGLK
jgi:8-oxo-dGTP diphosphatase